MSARSFLVMLCLAFAFAVSCAAQRQDATPVLDGTAATWQFDDDANVAYPACPQCGEVADRGRHACGNCGARVEVEPKTIACPECKGSKDCAHCAASHACIACRGTHLCAICDGAGQWRGEPCPECDGGKACRECVPGAPVACERCEGTRACANCDATGSIALR